VASTEHHPGSIVSVFSLPTPLARLCGIACQAGIHIGDYDAAFEDAAAAIVACGGETIALNPALGSDDLRADVLAMALDIAARITSHDTGHSGAITAPGGLVIITGNRIPSPESGPGAFATVLARKCGRDTASAAFTYYVPSPTPTTARTKTRPGREPGCRRCTLRSPTQLTPRRH
jgi:hypothetical protein